MCVFAIRVRAANSPLSPKAFKTCAALCLALLQQTVLFSTRVCSVQKGPLAKVGLLISHKRLRPLLSFCYCTYWCVFFVVFVVDSKILTIISLQYPNDLICSLTSVRIGVVEPVRVSDFVN